MFRFALIAVSLLVCGAALSCQPYSKGLEQSVTRADEVGAISALHTIVLAQRTYSISNSGSYGSFPQLVKAGALDSRFDSDTPKLKGYVLVMTVANGANPGEDSYTVSADPETPGSAPGRHFFVDSSAMIHVNPTQAATATDPPLGQ